MTLSKHSRSPSPASSRRKRRYSSPEEGELEPTPPPMTPTPSSSQPLLQSSQSNQAGFKPKVAFPFNSKKKPITSNSGSVGSLPLPPKPLSQRIEPRLGDNGVEPGPERKLAYDRPPEDDLAIRERERDRDSRPHDRRHDRNYHPSDRQQPHERSLLSHLSLPPPPPARGGGGDHYEPPPPSALHPSDYSYHPPSHPLPPRPHRQHDHYSPPSPAPRGNWEREREREPPPDNDRDRERNGDSRWQSSDHRHYRRGGTPEYPRHSDNRNSYRPSYDHRERDRDRDRDRDRNRRKRSNSRSPSRSPPRQRRRSNSRSRSRSRSRVSPPPPRPSPPPRRHSPPPPPPSSNHEISKQHRPVSFGLPPKPVAAIASLSSSAFSPPSSAPRSLHAPPPPSSSTLGGFSPPSTAPPPPSQPSQTPPPPPPPPAHSSQQQKRATTTPPHPPPSQPSAHPPRSSKPSPRRRPWAEEQEIYSYKDPESGEEVMPFQGGGQIKDYNVEGKLGEGTFGEVHLATHSPTNDRVALKRIFMHNEKEGMPITALREIKILKALKHKNVVELREVVVVRQSKANKSPLIYMVFPYMDHDLAGLLENEKVMLTPSIVKLWFKQLLEGTEYLHRNQILHRDMKAANLLINNQGLLQIADFGLARPFNPMNSAKKVMAMDLNDPEFPKQGSGKKARPEKYTNCVVTRWYRPPELLLGARHYGGEVDMWGVGCVLGEMFARRPILQGETDIDQLERIWKLCGTATKESWPNWEELPGCEGVKRFVVYERTLRQKYSELGEETVDLLDKLLTLDPSKRPTATEALDHDYFWTDPLPADPHSVPKYESSHEYDRARQRAAREPQKQQHQGGGAPRHQPIAQSRGGRDWGQQQHHHHGGRGGGGRGGGGYGGGGMYQQPGPGLPRIPVPLGMSGRRPPPFGQGPPPPMGQFGGPPPPYAHPPGDPPRGPANRPPLPPPRGHGGGGGHGGGDHYRPNEPSSQGLPY